MQLTHGQNQPSRGEEGKLIRSLFIARPGHKLIVADYSMMELRVAAHMSQDAEMLRAFAERLDLHTLTAASQQFLDYETVEEGVLAGDPDMKRARMIGKTSNFGLLYGMGPRKFQRYLLVETGVKVTLEEAEHLIDDFNSTYAGVTKWKRAVERFAINHEYVPTLGGRKRRFPGLKACSRDESAAARKQTSYALRQAVNAAVQGSCADIMLAAMPPIAEALATLGGYLLLQVHDELVAEAPEETAEQCATVLERLMVEEANRRLTVPLVAEAGIGSSWGEAK